MDFNNKTVLLTGASSGIGYELVKKIAQYKVKLVIAARRFDKLTELAKQIKNENNQVFPVQADVSHKEEISSLVNTAVEKLGKIDIAILNSGTSYRLSFDKREIHASEEVMMVNTMSYLYFFDELVPLMKSNGGIIAGVSSLADTRGFPYSGVYSASKAAASRLLESYRAELKKYNIRVVIIKPGFVRTPMTDKNTFYMPFMMGPEKAARIIFRGLIKEKRIIQFPLPTVILSKLVKLVPNPIFDLVSSKVK